MNLKETSEEIIEKLYNTKETSAEIIEQIFRGLLDYLYFFKYKYSHF